MSSSSSTSTGGSLTFAILGGVVTGGIAGAALTAVYLKRKETKGDDDTTTTTARGIRSRGFTPKVYGEKNDDGTSPTNRRRNNQNFDDVKHVNFLSDIMARLWPYINRAGSAMIKESVEPTFRETMPGPLKSLRFTDIDLGDTPIIIDNIIVHEEKKDDGSIQFDWDVTWDSKCNIQLKADMGIAFGVKAIELRGRMSFLMKPLSDVIPCVDAVTYTFINPPTLEIDFTGLANVADWSIVEDTIRQTINDAMASMVVLPIRMMTKLAPASHLFDIHTPMKGVARVTVISGRGFVEEKRALRSPDIPDVYLKLKLGTSTPWKSPTVHNHLSPNWADQAAGQQKDEKDANQNVKDFLLADLEQVLSIEAWDEDQGMMDSDDFLGSTEITVGQLLLAGKTMELELWTKEKKGSSKPTGAYVTIVVDILPFTSAVKSALHPNKILEAPVHPANQLVGLVTLLVSQAFDLPVPKDEAESFVKVWHGENEVGVTGTVTPLPGYDALNPMYEVPFYIPLTPSNCDKAKVKMQLMNKETVLGEVVIRPEELLNAKNGSIREKKMIGTDGASLEFAVSVCGLTASSHVEASKASLASTTPVAVGTSQSSKQVEISIVKGFGFASTKKRRFKKADIPDVYCIVKFGSNPQSWRTKTAKNSTTPSWGESRDYVMTSPNNVISIEVYDENRKTKDDYFGSARISVGKVMLAGGTSDVEITSGDGRNRTGLFLTITVKYV